MTQSSTQARNWRDLIRPKALIEEDRELHTDFYGKFVCEPLERGFGITIGNSLRRVLLSSLQGAAITAVRIDGALHEFTTIDDVKEDVADIILNLKEVVFQANEAKRYTLRLDGFASLHAPYDGGEMLTKPFVLEGEDDCREADSVAEAIDHETVTLLAERGSGIAQQAIVSCGEAGCVQMVCNANGAWLCDVTETWRQIAA